VEGNWHIICYSTNSLRGKKAVILHQVLTPVLSPGVNPSEFGKPYLQSPRSG